MSGTKDQPSLVDDSETLLMVNNPSWGGGECEQVRFGNPPNKFRLSPSTTLHVEEPQPQTFFNFLWGAPDATMGAEPVFAAALQIKTPTVHHESPYYMVAEESPPPPPRPNAVDSISPRPSPERMTDIQYVDGISYLVRPSVGGSLGGEHSSHGGGSCTCCSAPGALVLSYGRVLWSLGGWMGGWSGRWWVIANPFGWWSLIVAFQRPHSNAVGW